MRHSARFELTSLGSTVPLRHESTTNTKGRRGGLRSTMTIASSDLRRLASSRKMVCVPLCLLLRSGSSSPWGCVCEVNRLTGGVMSSTGRVMEPPADHWIRAEEITRQVKGEPTNEGQMLLFDGSIDPGDVVQVGGSCFPTLELVSAPNHPNIASERTRAPS
jgi:hypothetical protein